MKVPVQLYVRVKLTDGSYPYLKAVFLPNGHVRPGYAINAGRSVKIEGVYNLSYRKDGKRVWEPIGADPVVALVRLTAKKRELEDAKLAQPTSTPTTAPVSEQNGAPVATPDSKPHPTKRSLISCVAKYLNEIREHREKKTYSAYSKSILSFAEHRLAIKEDGSLFNGSSAIAVEDLNRDDALAWIAALRKAGNQPRTLFNRANNLNIFMRHFGLPPLFSKKDKPKFTDKKVRAYNEVELAKLFEAADEDEADLLYFLLCTGAREQEASFAHWTDLDLVAKTYKVTEHLDLGYRPKDKEEGTLPIADLFIERMKARRKRYPSTRLIFETATRKPERHMLRIIKSLALRAGVNCGECVNKKGKSCIEHPVCKHFVFT